jgi:hypothetical protein
MATHSNAKPSTREAQVLGRLLSAQGIDCYGLFFVSGEGDFFPNGVEETSAFVVDGMGRVYSFWTGWDDERQDVRFDEWASVSPEPDWLGDDEYIHACQRAGLDLPSTSS